MKDVVAGGISGFIATAPMTAAMEAMHRQLPWYEQYPLPPREITEKMAEEAGMDDNLDEEEQVEATLVNHFAYGAACGTVYGMMARHLPGPPVAHGIGFGLVVWTGSYLGLLPALGILKPATEHPARRNALMIAAHVVWGAAAGMAFNALAEDYGD